MNSRSGSPGVRETRWASQTFWLRVRGWVIVSSLGKGLRCLTMWNNNVK